MSKIDDLVWCEKYRPQTVEDIVLPKRLKDYFQEMVKTGKLQNMSLVGGAGTGKTTVAKALCKELGYDYILINASEERNIETIRTTVRDYGSTLSLLSDMKCVILDEADGLNPLSSQPALRAMIEEFAGTCRFILTANFGNRLIEPLVSRCPIVDFTFTKEERKELVFDFAKRLKGILKAESVTADTDQLMNVVINNFPDFRKTLNLVQRYSVGGELQVSGAQGITDDHISDLLKALNDKNFAKMRKWVVEHMDNDGVLIRRGIYDKLFSVLQPSSIPEVILLLAKYDYNESFVADRELNTVAMLTEIMAAASFK